MRNGLTDKQIENVFIECLLSGTLYYGYTALLNFPDNSQYTIEENKFKNCMTLTHTETEKYEGDAGETYSVSVDVPHGVFNTERVLSTYINSALIQLEKAEREKANVPVHTGETIMNMVELCGFDKNEIMYDSRYYNLFTALLSGNSTFKLSDRYAVSTIQEPDEYYRFLDSVHAMVKDAHDHVDSYDIIKCRNMDNIIFMYADGFNSVSLNWGTTCGMNVQTTDSELIEMRDKLIKRFPLKHTG